MLKSVFKIQNSILQQQLLVTFLQTLILNSKHSFVTAYTNASFVFNTTFLNYEKLEIFVEFYDLSPAFYCPTQVCVSFNSWYDTDTMMLLLNLY